jgi:hypothetical protein
VVAELLAPLNRIVGGRPSKPGDGADQCCLGSTGNHTKLACNANAFYTAP